MAESGALLKWISSFDKSLCLMAQDGVWLHKRTNGLSLYSQTCQHTAVQLSAPMHHTQVYRETLFAVIKIESPHI